MKRRLRSITVTLEVEVAHWARIEAANRGTSVSRFLEVVLRERMVEEEQYREAKARALARKPFLNTGGRYLTRKDTHSR